MGWIVCNALFQILKICDFAFMRINLVIVAKPCNMPT